MKTLDLAAGDYKCTLFTAWISQESNLKSLTNKQISQLVVLQLITVMCEILIRDVVKERAFTDGCY